MVRNLQIISAVILASSMLFVIWGLPGVAWRVAVSALYTSTILFIIRKYVS